jgi:hypothetical protein
MSTATAVGTPDAFHLDLMGWYYRPSQDLYEFWWQGSTPLISLDAMMLSFMPGEICVEIRAATMIKAPLTD